MRSADASPTFRARRRTWIARLPPQGRGSAGRVTGRTPLRLARPTPGQRPRPGARRRAGARARHPSARLLETLCRQGPPELHHLFSSRVEPPFPVERLRGRGEVLSIDAATLAFSEAEVGELLASELGSDQLAPDDSRAHGGLAGRGPARSRGAARDRGGRNVRTSSEPVPARRQHLRLSRRGGFRRRGTRGPRAGAGRSTPRSLHARALR